MKPEVLDKLKKLLRLSKSPNPHEARLALEKAYEIAAANQVDLAGVDADSGGAAPFVFDYSKDKVRLANARWNIYQILQQFFSVSVLTAPGLCCLVGRPEDIEVGRYVLEFLNRVVSAEVESLKGFRKRQGRQTSILQVRQFVEGFFSGLRSGKGGSLDALLAAPGDRRAA